MAADILSVHNILVPQILAAEKDYLVVYKPPRIHSAPLASSDEKNLVHWCAQQFPEIVQAVPPRRAGEGGLLHRLDYETQGLLLVARTRTGMEALLARQSAGMILKEYSSLAAENNNPLPGFPLIKPGISPGHFQGSDGKPLQIRSAFRPFGEGRKAVRPVKLALSIGSSKENKIRGVALDSGNEYVTEITGAKPVPSGIPPGTTLFTLRIIRGFRHQIRCHLAWLGFPVLNDSLYGGVPCGKGLLGLRACSLSFTDPSSGKERVFSILPIDVTDI